MNNNEILEKTTVDKKTEKEIQKQKGYKAGYIACCVGVFLSLVISIFVETLTTVTAINLPLLGTTTLMICMGIFFTFALTLSITSKKARALYIILAALTGIRFIAEVASFTGGLIGML